jgi:hypothetical protein
MYNDVNNNKNEGQRFTVVTLNFLDLLDAISDLSSVATLSVCSGFTT